MLPTTSHVSQRYPQPLPLSSHQLSPGPHIRTPTPSRPASDTASPPRRSMTLPGMRMRLPRSLAQRLFLLLGVILSGVVLISMSRTPSRGVWDASSVADRHNVNGISIFRRLWGSSKPMWLREASRMPNYQTHWGAHLDRVNRTAPRRTSRGLSRIEKSGLAGGYETGPLPSIEEAFAHLHPMLRKVKEDTPAVPREHELWNPMFPPYLTSEQEERFQHLRADWDEGLGKWVEVERRWFMVTVCRQVAGMLADWFAAWTVLADFLGPESLYFSLLEGNSDDGSGEILGEVMRAHLLFIGVPPSNIHIRTLLPAVDWEAHHRIEVLADMRNAGMAPFYDTLPDGLTPDGKPWTGIVWYNDVYLSAQHFLELMHQHMAQGADITCGWDHAGRFFYDGWVGRDMSGDLYTPFPLKEEDKDLPQKLFLSHAATRERHARNLPFQVFAGWNGIAVMRPDPFYPPYNVRFRRGAPTKPAAEGGTASDTECQASESAFISWDYWKYGFGRVAVVPGVHATYGKDDARIRGWIEWPEVRDGYKEQIAWDDTPPRKIRCHDWPDKPGKGWWAWDNVRWVDPPALVIPDGATRPPRPKNDDDAAPGVEPVKA